MKPIMKPKRLWIEIVAPSIVIACALALLIAILGAAAGVAAEGQESASAEPPAYSGMITDTQCGAKFALVDGNKTYVLDGDLAQLKAVVGKRATIKGDLSGNTIKVSSVVAGS
jgi:flagellar basal body-associated protein FliL